MASKTALPIARLRSLGCKVSTVIGHDPAISSFQYRVTLPEGVLVPLRASKFHGKARADVDQRDRGRVIVWASAYRGDRLIPPREVAEQNEADVAGLLNAIADAISKREYATS